jgi:hypothetical protein
VNANAVMADKNGFGIPFHSPCWCDARNVRVSAELCIEICGAEAVNDWYQLCIQFVEQRKGGPSDTLFAPRVDAS